MSNDLDFEEIEENKEELQIRLRKNGSPYNELAKKCKVSFEENDEPVHKSVNIDKLDRMYIDHSQETKVLKGLEIIAYEDTGVYEVLPKSSNSIYSKLELRAHPDSCREFLMNPGANYLYVISLGQTIYRLIQENKDKRHAAADFSGRVWIPTSTIIREMTRTKEGSNKNAPRNEAVRDKVMDALLMLSSCQVRTYDKKGKIVFSDYVLQACYYQTIKDDCGNIIHDVWGFPKNMEGLFLRTDDHTQTHQLLPTAPLRESEIWITQLVGDMVSEVRASLYSKRRAKTSLGCAKRSWDEIFININPLAGGNHEARTKNRVVNNIEKLIKAFAEEVASDQNKPMYIWAETKFNPCIGRGRGKRVELIMYGSIAKRGETKDL